jgi:hypothetical protein
MLKESLENDNFLQVLNAIIQHLQQAESSFTMAGKLLT